MDWFNEIVLSKDIFSWSSCFKLAKSLCKLLKADPENLIIDNELKIIDNPDAFNDDNKEKLHDSFDDEPKQLFSINQPYKVVLNKNTAMPTFSINEISKRQQDRDARSLGDGDIINFRF